MSHGYEYDNDDYEENEMSFSDEYVISAEELEKLIEYARREQRSLRSTNAHRRHDFYLWLRQQIEYIVDTSRVHWRDIMDIIFEQVGLTWPDESPDSDF